MADFELAELEAFREIFRSIDTSGCFFHFAQLQRVIQFKRGARVEHFSQAYVYE